MKWVFYYIFIICFTLFNAKIATAQMLRLKAHYNIRSSPDFLSSTNVVGDLREGSLIEVLEKKPLPSGAYGLRIEILSTEKDSRKINSAQKWIYKLNETHFADITDSKRTIAEVATISQITTQAQAPAACATCLGDAAAFQKNSNQKELGLVTQHIEQDANTIPNLREQVKNYSNSPEVKKSLATGMRLFSRKKSKGFCYTAIKKILAASGLVPNDRIGGESALSAKDTLKEQFGFINLLDILSFKTEIITAADAPVGSVLVYSSDNKCKRSKIPDCGHIEMKTENGFISDFYTKNLITRKPQYKLVAVMVKPMANGAQ